MSDFETFLKWEERSRDTIDFKKAYVDMAGDVVAGLMLSQIVYWHLPCRNGEGKLRVERDGFRWLVKSRDEWWEECRLNPREVDRARKVLEERGIIEVRLYKFNGSPTQHIRIHEGRFLELWRAVLEGETLRAKKKFDRGASGSGGQGGDQSGAGSANASDTHPETDHRATRRAKPLKSPISLISEIHFTKQPNPFNQSVKSISLNSENLITETTTENTSQNTAAAIGTGKPVAAAALLELLVGHGVGRRVAIQLAREKPEVCRRCLEYLPYAKFRTTKGAWLANAIRDEYGPPEGYVGAKRREERAKSRARECDADRMHLDGRSSKQKARLRERYAQMETSRNGAYTAFIEHLASERARAEQFAINLSEEGGRKYLAAFDSPDFRLEIFQQWLERSGSAGPKVTVADSLVRPEGEGGLETPAPPPEHGIPH